MNEDLKATIAVGIREIITTAVASLLEAAERFAQHPHESASWLALYAGASRFDAALGRHCVACGVAADEDSKSQLLDALTPAMLDCTKSVAHVLLVRAAFDLFRPDSPEKVGERRRALLGAVELLIQEMEDTQ